MFADSDSKNSFFMPQKIDILQVILYLLNDAHTICRKQPPRQTSVALQEVLNDASKMIKMYLARKGKMKNVSRRFTPQNDGPNNKYGRARRVSRLTDQISNYCAYHPSNRKLYGGAFCVKSDNENSNPVDWADFFKKHEEVSGSGFCKPKEQGTPFNYVEFLKQKSINNDDSQNHSISNSHRTNSSASQLSPSVPEKAIFLHLADLIFKKEQEKDTESYGLAVIIDSKDVYKFIDLKRVGNSIRLDVDIKIDKENIKNIVVRLFRNANERLFLGWGKIENIQKNIIQKIDLKKQDDIVAQLEIKITSQYDPRHMKRNDLIPAVNLGSQRMVFYLDPRDMFESGKSPEKNPSYSSGSSSDNLPPAPMSFLHRSGTYKIVSTNSTNKTTK